MSTGRQNESPHIGSSGSDSSNEDNPDSRPPTRNDVSSSHGSTEQQSPNFASISSSSTATTAGGTVTAIQLEAAIEATATGAAQQASFQSPLQVRGASNTGRDTAHRSTETPNTGQPTHSSGSSQSCQSDKENVEQRSDVDLSPSLGRGGVQLQALDLSTSPSGQRSSPPASLSNVHLPPVPGPVTGAPPASRFCEGCRKQIPRNPNNGAFYCSFVNPRFCRDACYNIFLGTELLKHCSLCGAVGDWTLQDLLAQPWYKWPIRHCSTCRQLVSPSFNPSAGTMERFDRLPFNPAAVGPGVSSPQHPLAPNPSQPPAQQHPHSQNPGLVPPNHAGNFIPYYLYPGNIQERPMIPVTPFQMPNRSSSEQVPNPGHQQGLQPCAVTSTTPNGSQQGASCNVPPHDSQMQQLSSSLNLLMPAHEQHQLPWYHPAHPHFNGQNMQDDGFRPSQNIGTVSAPSVPITAPVYEMITPPDPEVRSQMSQLTYRRTISTSSSEVDSAASEAPSASDSIQEISPPEPVRRRQLCTEPRTADGSPSNNQLHPPLQPPSTSGSAFVVVRPASVLASGGAGGTCVVNSRPGTAPLSQGSVLQVNRVPSQSSLREEEQRQQSMRQTVSTPRPQTFQEAYQLQQRPTQEVPPVLRMRQQQHLAASSAPLRIDIPHRANNQHPSHHKRPRQEASQAGQRNMGPAPTSQQQTQYLPVAQVMMYRQEQERLRCIQQQQQHHCAHAHPPHYPGYPGHTPGPMWMHHGGNMGSGSLHHSGVSSMSVDGADRSQSVPVAVSQQPLTMRPPPHPFFIPPVPSAGAPRSVHTAPAGTHQRPRYARPPPSATVTSATADSSLAPGSRRVPSERLLRAGPPTLFHEAILHQENGGTPLQTVQRLPTRSMTGGGVMLERVTNTAPPALSGGPLLQGSYFDPSMTDRQMSSEHGRRGRDNSMVAPRCGGARRSGRPPKHQASTDRVSDDSVKIKKSKSQASSNSKRSGRRGGWRSSCSRRDNPALVDEAKREYIGGTMFQHGSSSYSQSHQGNGVDSMSSDPQTLLQRAHRSSPSSSASQSEPSVYESGAGRRGRQEEERRNQERQSFRVTPVPTENYRAAVGTVSEDLLPPRESSTPQGRPTAPTEMPPVERQNGSAEPAASMEHQQPAAATAATSNGTADDGNNGTNGFATANGRSSEHEDGSRRTIPVIITVSSDSRRNHRGAVAPQLHHSRVISPAVMEISRREQGQLDNIAEEEKGGDAEIRVNAEVAVENNVHPHEGDNQQATHDQTENDAGERDMDIEANAASREQSESAAEDAEGNSIVTTNVCRKNDDNHAEEPGAGPSTS